MMSNLAFTAPLSLTLNKNQNSLHVSSKASTSTSLSTRPRQVSKAVLSEEAPATAPSKLPNNQTEWTPSSWRSHLAAQQPDYPDEQHLHQVEDTIKRLPPLVAPGELSSLKKQLGNVCNGTGFILQGGDCAEDLNEPASAVKDTMRSLFQMAVILMWGAQQPVVKIGRIAGQYGKPRSNRTETKDGVTLPVYRGENINGAEFTKEARTPDPERMLLAHNRSVGTSNLVRAFAQGGFGDLRRVSEWGTSWTKATGKGHEYMETAERITDALNFINVCGISQNEPVMTSTEVFTSHEGLLLPYEEALVRQDPRTGEYYCGSGHLIWVGERTRDLDGAHIEFVRGISNPIGLKVGPKMKPEELLRACDILNPKNEPGRLTLITRMGADKILQGLPPLVRAIKEEGRNVVWVSDSMHGNTFNTENGFKTRSWSRVMTEVRGFFAVHEAEGTKAGGLHFEMTGKKVTECVGGIDDIQAKDLSRRYESLCDPRLNNSQALEMAFEAAEILRSNRLRGLQ